MTTYGEYRDATARALAALLGEPANPQLSATQVQRVLGCRDLLLASLQQQFRLATGAAGSSNLQLASVESNPVSAFGAVLDRVPMVGPGDAPTDVLTTCQDEASSVASWRQAARWSLLAADVLDTTHAWRTDPNATWAAVADAADAAEAAWALSVLDTDLRTLQRSDGVRNRTEAGGGGLGLLARLTVDLAHQGPFNPNPNLDRLTRPALARVGPRPLSQFAQVVDGENRVARMLHQRDGVVPVKALGPLLVGQARIAAAIAEGATQLQRPATAEHGLNGHQRDTAAALAGAARARAEALTAAAKARKGVADVLTGAEPLVWQTAEVLRTLRRRPRPADRDPAVAQLRQLTNSRSGRTPPAGCSWPASSALSPAASICFRTRTETNCSGVRVPPKPSPRSERRSRTSTASSSTPNFPGDSNPSRIRQLLPQPLTRRSISRPPCVPAVPNARSRQACGSASR